MPFTVTVLVRPKAGLRDPEGATVQEALAALGYDGVGRCHVGKVVEFELDAADETAARSAAVEMCERILANPVIEDYEIHV
ncbi:MAG: phosphoribosylformylglycinamidine synthase subunit PurS [Acidimicrobiia bacterium]|nr:phosphoribosylformylglycinamidine synthase subunit PurS [Acidimicrobiia bacterium]